MTVIMTTWTQYQITSWYLPLVSFSLLPLDLQSLAPVLAVNGGSSGYIHVCMPVPLHNFQYLYTWSGVNATLDAVPEVAPRTDDFPPKTCERCICLCIIIRNIHWHDSNHCRLSLLEDALILKLEFSYQPLVHEQVRPHPLYLTDLSWTQGHLDRHPLQSVIEQLH